MPSVKFLLIGDAGVGKSSLLQVYLWKLNNGASFHDNRIDKLRYRIDVIEILSFDQLQYYHNASLYANQRDIVISVFCFSVADRKTLGTLRRVWIPEVLKINKDAKAFLMGLQCDLREQFLTKLKQNCFSTAEGTQVCRYYENIDYVECSCLKLASVNAAFEQMLEIVFYEDVQKQLEEQILKLYADMQIKFEFYGPIVYLDQKKNKLVETEVEEEKISGKEIETLDTDIKTEMVLVAVINEDREFESLAVNDESQFEPLTFNGGGVCEPLMLNEESQYESLIINVESEYESLITNDESEAQLVTLKYETDLDAAFFENESEAYDSDREHLGNEVEDVAQDELPTTVVFLNDRMELEEVVLRTKKWHV